MIIGLGLLALLFSQVSISLLWVQIRTISFLWLVLSGLVFVVIYFLRTWRFLCLLPDSVSFWKQFCGVSIQGLANLILPARLGDVGFLYYLKNYNVPISKSLSSLIIARTFDFIALGLFFLMFLFVVDTSAILSSTKIVMVVQIFFTVFAIIFVFAVLLKEWVWEWVWNRLEIIIIKSPLSKNAQSIRQTYFVFVTSFSGLSKNRNSLKIFVISLAIWATTHIFGYLCIVKVLHLPLTLPETVFMLSFVQLVTLLPIHPPGGVGTIDAAWAFSVMSFGVAKELAISSALTAHMMTYFYSIMLGIVAYSVLLLTIRKVP
jgi:uncharacterized protein (TIRG00374 family)